MYRGPWMLCADAQHKVSPCLSILNFPAILMEQGSENRETSFLQESQFKKKNHIYKPMQNVSLLHVVCSLCSASACWKSLMGLAQGCSRLTH